MKSTFSPVQIVPVPLPRRTGCRALIAAILVLAIGCSPSPLPPPSNILLITIDTLRADHLSAYGYVRQTSPVLDRLATEGIRFEQPVAQWPKTGPSFASIFTSTYPKDNGVVRKVGENLPLEFRMLAEELQALGYATRAVVANGALGSEFNFHQGFNDYIESWKLSPPDEGTDATGAEMITRLARTAMTRHDPAQPYFLWVHYLDPHFPYQAPEPWTDRFVNDAYFDPTVKIDIATDRPRRQMTGIGSEQVLGGRDELAYYVARYDAEIAYTDDQIGKLFEFLGARGLLEATLTAVTSDHGESLGEHYYYFDHGRFGYQTCLRVPLILHYPGVIEPRVVREPVELLRLAPTLLEAAGVRLRGGRWMQGRSLWPLLLGEHGAAGRSPLAFAEAGHATDRKWQRIVTDGRYKLIFAPASAEQRWIGGEGNPLALYDLGANPGETENLVERLPEETRRLKKALGELWSAPPFEVMVDTAASADDQPREIEDETRQQLKALGYLQ